MSSPFSAETRTPARKKSIPAFPVLASSRAQARQENGRDPLARDRGLKASGVMPFKRTSVMDARCAAIPRLPGIGAARQ